MYEMLQADCARLGPRDLFGLYFVPLSWDSSVNPLIFPFPKTYRWDSLEKVIRHIDAINGIACATPQIWQIEPLVQAVARPHGLPIAITPPQNLPILRPFCEQAGIDVVITTPDLLSDVHMVLAKTEPKPKAVLVIHQDVSTFPTKTVRAYPYVIVHELHLIPGIPLMFQTLESAQTPDSVVLVSKNNILHWHLNTTLSVDLPGDWPVHTADIELPFTIAEVEDKTEIYTIHV